MCHLMGRCMEHTQLLLSPSAQHFPKYRENKSFRFDLSDMAIVVSHKINKTKTFAKLLLCARNNANLQIMNISIKKELISEYKMLILLQALIHFLCY